MRRIALILAATSAVAVLGAVPSRATAAPTFASTTHPYFNDQGTLAWYCDLAAAQEAGRASGKLVFIEYGRRACCNCRTLVSRVLPAPAVKSRLSARCVGLAADCDEPDPRVEAVFRRAMPDASLLPFVAVVSPDLDYVTGWQGAMDVAACSLEVARVEAWQERAARRATAATKLAKPALPGAPCAPGVPAIRATSTEIPVARPAATTAGATAPDTSPAPACGVGSSQGVGSQAAALAAARELLRQAEFASGAGHHAEVLRLEREAAALSIRVEPARWAATLAAADAWAEGLLAEAAAAALAGRTTEAEARIAAVRRDAVGRGASIDAERGARALTLRRFIESASAATREKATTDARNSFRGTRWAALFSA